MWKWHCFPYSSVLYKWVMISSGKRKEPAGVWTAVVVNGQTPGFWEYFSPDEKQTDMVSDRLENVEKDKCKAEFCMHFEQIKKK